MKLKRGVVLGIILFVLAWAVIAAGVFSFYFKIPEPLWEGLLPLPEGDHVAVLVEPGMNARQAAHAFEEQGALDGTASRLAYWMTRLGVDRKIQAGRYYVVRSDPWRLARQLRGMRPALLRMTVIPGMDRFSLRESLSMDAAPKVGDAVNAAVMDDAMYPEDLREKLPASEESRIAFLLPETYLVVEQTPKDLVRVASAGWQRRCGPSLAKLSSRELEEAAIVASMVEREALWDSECRRIAGVIHNRLKKGMPLQIDATVVYAWRLRGRKVTRVLNSDLTVQSPYNTYNITGLPPHPICIPGPAAWEAALDPEKNNYYYYVAGKTGYHTFATTYSEHLRNVRKARAER
ncbi:MAG: endolytic transglycosylase MltG [Synergistaceae bacterium]|nr:endolytic transglycosylase MltG [Synergistaceae bacterium]